MMILTAPVRGVREEGRNGGGRMSLSASESPPATVGQQPSTKIAHIEIPPAPVTMPATAPVGEPGGQHTPMV